MKSWDANTVESGTTSEYFEQLDETLADLLVDIQDYRELGDRVVALGVIRGAGKASQVEVANDFAVVLVVRNLAHCSRRHLQRSEGCPRSRRA